MKESNSCPDYRYQCRDNSILTPLFRRFVVRPIMPLVPGGLPANIITIVSNLILYCALFLVLTQDHRFLLNFTLIPILIFLYAVGDHVDGMQAQRTRTSSPLGEFIDHFLDLFNTAALPAMFLLMFRIPVSPPLVFLFLSIYLAEAAVYYEQYRTKWLVFERVSSLEGCFLIALGMLAGNWIPFKVGVFWRVAWGLTVAELGFLVVGVFGLLTFLRVWQRVGNFSLRFGGFCASATLLAMVACFLADKTTALVLLSLYCVEYIGRVMYAHLVDGVERFPDFVVPLVITVGFGVSAVFREAEVLFLFVSVVYTIMLIVLLVYRTFSRLKQCWLWMNPL